MPPYWRSPELCNFMEEIEPFSVEMLGQQNNAFPRFFTS